MVPARLGEEVGAGQRALTGPVATTLGDHHHCRGSGSAGAYDLSRHFRPTHLGGVPRCWGARTFGLSHLVVRHRGGMSCPSASEVMCTTPIVGPRIILRPSLSRSPLIAATYQTMAGVAVWARNYVDCRRFSQSSSVSQPTGHARAGLPGPQMQDASMFCDAGRIVAETRHQTRLSRLGTRPTRSAREGSVPRLSW